jgi:hypothetical protein
VPPTTRPERPSADRGTDPGTATPQGAGL